MTPSVRKLTLTAHITSSVGWLGAVVAYLVIAIAGLTSADPQMVRGAYLVTALIGWLFIASRALTATASIGSRRGAAGRARCMASPSGAPAVAVAPARRP